MPHWHAFSATRNTIALGLGAAALASGGVLVWRLLRPKTAPEEAERRRRTELSGKGKLSDGEVIDLEGAAIVYSYSVGGVGYTASQDVLDLEAMLPEDRMSVVGPALVKFDPRNPANSIVLCEDWSGLHGRKRSTAGQP